MSEADKNLSKKKRIKLASALRSDKPQPMRKAADGTNAANAA